MAEQRRTRRAARPAAAEQAQPAAANISVEIHELATDPITVEVTEGATVRQVLSQAGVSATNRTIRVRGERVNLDQVVQAHDLLVLTPQIRGG